MTVSIKTRKSPDHGLYETDAYSWALRQAAALREGRFADLDLDNLAEEIESVGRSEYDKLESALTVLLTHMLKWDLQADFRSRSWEATIAEQRRRVGRVLRENPGLKSRLAEAVGEAYGDARHRSSGETGLAIAAFPQDNPYDWQAITEREFVLAGESSE